MSISDLVAVPDVVAGQVTDRRGRAGQRGLRVRCRSRSPLRSWRTRRTGLTGRPNRSVRLGRFAGGSSTPPPPSYRPRTRRTPVRRRRTRGPAREAPVGQCRPEDVSVSWPDCPPLTMITRNRTPVTTISNASSNRSNFIDALTENQANNPMTTTIAMTITHHAMSVDARRLSTLDTKPPNRSRFAIDTMPYTTRSTRPITRPAGAPSPFATAEYRIPDDGTRLANCANVEHSARAPCAPIAKTNGVDAPAFPAISCVSNSARWWAR